MKMKQALPLGNSELAKLTNTWSCVCHRFLYKVLREHREGRYDPDGVTKQFFFFLLTSLT